MINLIISFDTYSWVQYVAGTIMSDKEPRYDLMIIKRDDELPLLSCKYLCKKAIYEQRRYDLFKIGKKIGITKLMNLGYNSKLPINKMVAQLQLYVMLSNINIVYAPNNHIFTSIFKNTNTKLHFYDFGNQVHSKILDKNVYKSKIDLKNVMIGIGNKSDSDLYKPIERVYK